MGSGDKRSVCSVLLPPLAIDMRSGCLLCIMKDIGRVRHAATTSYSSLLQVENLRLSEWLLFS